MKRFLLTGVLAALAVTGTQAAQAENSSRAEVAGVGSGAAIGGALAGPPGLILGAAIGAVFGERWHRKGEKVDTLNAALAARDTDMLALNAELASEQVQVSRLKHEMTALDESGVRELHRLLGKGLEIDLPFRTDETQLPDGLSERIAGIAGLLATTPGLAVQIDGYADPRGSIEYNAALSLQRAEHVRQLLTQAGLNPSKIVTFGHGESIVNAGLQIANPDQLALERRVTVTFYRDETANTGIANLTGSID